MPTVFHNRELVGGTHPPSLSEPPPRAARTLPPVRWLTEGVLPCIIYVIDWSVAICALEVHVLDWLTHSPPVPWQARRQVVQGASSSLSDQEVLESLETEQD